MQARNEMNPKFMWDFTHMYESDEAWEQALAGVVNDLDRIAAIEGTLGTSREAFKTGVDTVTEIGEQLEKAYIYAMLHLSADGSEPKHQEMNQRAIGAYVRFSSAVAFMDPEILAIPQETLDAFLAPDEMKPYRHYVENLTRTRAHCLDAQRERMLAELGDAAQAPQDAYEMLTNVDMLLPKIHDENGNEVQLTSGNFGVFRESGSRAVREEAFNAMFGTYKQFINTFAALYGGNVKQDQFLSNTRGYASACAAALDRNNVPVSVYDSLIEAVHESLPAMREYLELRREALGLEKLDMYDLYCPMVKDVDYKVPFEEAKHLVKEATKPLGEEYRKLLDRAFSENWIDVYENKGKRSGAFSCGVYGVHPYVLLNYTDALDDAFTTAHELGHAMHSFHSDRAQDFMNHDYCIFVAEVASTVNEVLLTKYLLKTETDKARRAYVLNHFLEGFRTTLFRQTLFAEFERKAHEAYQNGEPLTAEKLTDIYRSLVALYYDGAELPENIGYEWAYIPHFYTAFYVFQYATGFSSAVAIGSHLAETGDAEGYLKFLSTGGSDYPLNELKLAGVDLTSPQPVKDALKVFADCVHELKELLKEL